jgi:2-C-methyl-D-erythritol 4-phosphate cytidylyltransferase
VLADLQSKYMPITPDIPRLHALVPCAGTGSRAGTSIPKQYQLVAGQPMVMHTLQALAHVPQLASGWVILSPGDPFAWPQDGWPAHFRREACGGATRAESVFNGLSAMLQSGVAADDWVLVHDAARCLITPEAVSDLVEACRDDTVGGLLALPLPDTLKSHTLDGSNARVASTVPREDKWLAQTPQMFRLGALHAALADASATGFAGITDESSAMERLGLLPRLVPGSAQNLKVTYPADFAFAEAVLKGRT